MFFRLRLSVSIAAALCAALAGCGAGATPETPVVPPGSPTAVIVLPPGALASATPTATSSPTPTTPPPPSLTPTEACRNDAAFDGDVNYPDGTPIAPGSHISKLWRVRNTGDCAWDDTYHLVQVSTGALQADNPSSPLPPVAPGQTVEIGLTASLSSEAHIGAEAKAIFELQDPSGQKFGTNLTIKIVAAEGTPASLTEPPPSSGAASISGLVWNDYCHPGNAQGGTGPDSGHCLTTAQGGKQADGIIQSSEKGIAGIVVNLSAGSCPPSDVTTTQTTDSAGKYRFDGLGPGGYCVWIDPLNRTNAPILIPGGWSVVVGLTSDNSGKAEATVIIAAGEPGTIVNFGWDYQLD